MSKHRSIWNVIGNIIVGLATVGLALGFKLIHSKLSTGRGHLFFDTTKKQEQIQSIEKLVLDLKPAKSP